MLLERLSSEAGGVRIHFASFFVQVQPALPVLDRQHLETGKFQTFRLFLIHMHIHKQPWQVDNEPQQQAARGSYAEAV